MFRSFWEKFRRCELAHDLAEYCLLTALVALIALGIIWHTAGGIDGIWGGANSTLATGNSGNTTGAGAGTASTPAH